MKHVRKMQVGSFIQYSLSCMCDPDLMIQDHEGTFHCGECMEPLEKVESKELPMREQENVLVKLRLQKKMAAEGKDFAEYSVDDDSDDEF